MKILVAVKSVIDYKTRIRVKSDQSGVVSDGVKMSINPFDEIAVEEAVRLKEKGLATEIILVTIGQKNAQEILRHGFALGGDRGIFIETEADFEPINNAKILKAVAEKEEPDLIILGKQAIDDDCNQTGQMLAALLAWPQATFISQLNIQGSMAQAVREIDTGLEKIQINLPAVVTTDLRLNEPRYVSLPNIMKAKQKSIEEIKVTDLPVTLKSHSEILSIEAPSERVAGERVENFKDLFKKLRNGVLSS